MRVEDKLAMATCECELQDHPGPCKNQVGHGELDDVVMTPRLCTPCLFGCAP